jgi:hypothetical protein
MTFFQENKSMLGFMDAVLGYHESGDDLLVSIDSNRSFQEMFSQLSGSDGIVMTRISAGEPGGIDGGDRDWTVVRIELFQGTFEEKIEINRFDPAEEFLKCREVRNRQKIQRFPDAVHFFEVTDNRTIVFFPVFFEQENGQKLVLGIIPPRIFAGIEGKTGWSYKRECMFDKTDKPARRSLDCLLPFCAHNL